MTARESQSSPGVEVSLAAIQNDGFIVLPQLIDPADFNELSAYGALIIKRCLARHGSVGNVAHNIFRSSNILRDFPLSSVLSLEAVHHLLHAVLGNDYALVEGFVHFSLPASGVQELHSDAVCMGLDQDRGQVPPLMAFHFPLGDFNYQSGGTRIIPGTQRSDKLPPSSLDEPVEFFQQVPTMRPRDVLIRDCRTWHAAGRNQTAETRAMFSFAVARHGVLDRTRVAPDLYFAIPPRLRRCLVPER